MIFWLIPIGLLYCLIFYLIKIGQTSTPKFNRKKINYEEICETIQPVSNPFANTKISKELIKSYISKSITK